MKYKIEIVDDENSGSFVSHLYFYKKIKWWGKLGWNLKAFHYLGRNYMCPKIYNKSTTVEEMFEENNQNWIKTYKIKEIHRININ